MNADTYYAVVAFAVMAFICGLIVGAVLAILISERAQSRLARYQRTGRPEVAPQQDTSHVPGGEFSGVSEEAKAAERARQRVIDNGAKRFMDLDPALTLDEARIRASKALAELGAFNMTV